MKGRYIAIVGMILAAALSRLIPHPYNFTPIMAIALFGGATLSRRLALVVPIAAMLLSDLIIGFHSQLVLVYASFALIVFMGRKLQDRRSVGRTAGIAFTSSLLFFVLTNLGVWAFDSLYPRTFDGLVLCYTAAIPFFQNQLVGDALYTATLFGGLALVERWVPSLKGQQVLA